MKQVVPKTAILICLLGPIAPKMVAQSGAQVTGTVRDTTGAPQMGALVELLAGDLVVARTFTDEQGRYLLAPPAPGRYGVKASATLTLPVQRSNLDLQSGVRVLANLTLSAIYEVGVLFPAERKSRAESPRDWRWTLRSSANRPLLRLGASQGASGQAGESSDPHLQGTVAFLATSGSFGTGNLQQSLELEAAKSIGHLGPSVEALAVELTGGDQASGSEGFLIRSDLSLPGLPGTASGISASVSSQPLIAVAGTSGAQVLTFAATRQITLGDAVLLDAGNLLVSERINGERSSSEPYLRVVAAPSAALALIYRLATDPNFQEGADARDRNAPPILTDITGRPELPRSLHQELGVAHSAGSDTETLMVYRDHLPVEGLDGVGVLAPGELDGLPIAVDGATETFRIATAGYTAHGISGSWTHRFGQSTTATGIAAYGSSLVADDGKLEAANLSTETHPASTLAASARVESHIAKSGTAFRAQYHWQGNRTLDCVDRFNSEGDAYLSASIRQRLWTSRTLHSLDIVADLRNLLEQGYQPIIGPDGEILFLTQQPRVLQAGLSFSF